MANKSNKFYFQNFMEAATYSCRAAEFLVHCLSDYHSDRIDTMLAQMHELEHQADEIRHEMSVALARAFVTPIDREDLADLSQCIDEVTDTIEEVLQRFYIHNIQTVPSDASVFAEKILACCKLMASMLTELEHFKKPDRLRKFIVDLNHAEEDCDQFYLHAAMMVKQQYNNAFDAIAWWEIFEYLENCADACEHVADSVERIIMKNT